VFRNWADPVEEERKHDNPLLVPMDSNKAVTAIFQTIDCMEDTACDDGQFCTGAEFCNTTIGECESAGSPCGTGERCNEGQDCCEVYVPAPCGACGEGAWVCVVIGSFLWLGLRFVGPGKSRRSNSGPL